MKNKRTPILIGALIVAGCLAGKTPIGIARLEAQAVPIAIHAQWDPPASADNVVNYTLIVDGGSPITVANTTDATCNCINAPITLALFGQHTVSVVANALLISTDPNSIQSSAPAVVTFILIQNPSSVTKLKAVK